MEEKSSDYIRKRLQDLSDGLVSSQRNKVLEEIEAGMKLYRKELDRLKEYATAEGINDLEQSVHKAVFMPKTSYVRGSFMEFAAPFMGFVEETIPELSKRVESLKTRSPEEYQIANEYFSLLKESIREFDNTPIRKLRNAADGKELLSAIWADINALHVFLSDSGIA